MLGTVCTVYGVDGLSPIVALLALAVAEGSANEDPFPRRSTPTQTGWSGAGQDQPSQTSGASGGQFHPDASD